MYFYPFAKFTYKPGIKVVLEKKTYYSDLNVLKISYFVSANAKIKKNDFSYIESLINKINTLVDFSDKPCSSIFYSVDLLSTLTIRDKENKDLCKYCNMELGNYMVYYCYFCNVFICNTCARNISKFVIKFGQNVKLPDELLECLCLQHNLILIIDYEETKKNKSLQDIEVGKIGKNYFNAVPQSDFYDLGFICSYCLESLYTGIRYVCLNCRGSDILYRCADDNFSGYIDICESCF